MDSTRLVGTGELARILGVTKTTINRWVAAGTITPAVITPGGKYRWDVADVLRVVPRRNTSPGDDAMDTDPSHVEPQPVVAAIVTSELGVLAGRRNDGKPPWTFIAGEIEPGESPEDAAVREVKEETGLLVGAGKVIGRRVHPKTHRTMIYMSAFPAGAHLDVFVGDQEELAEVRWLSLDEVDELMPGVFEPVRAFIAQRL
jgi:excisionase family DNA binding protein